MKILEESLRQTFLIFVAGGSILSLAVGIWMLLRPDGALRLNQYFSKWFATVKLTNVLDSPRSVERVLYRNHRLVGVLVLCGALYTLYSLLFSFNKQAVVALLSRGANSHLIGWLMDTLVVALVISSVLAAVIGIFLVVRPSLLRSFEQRVNSWYSTEKSMRTIDEMHLLPDEFVARHIRIVGVLIVLGSVYTIASLWVLLL